ncbi:SRPBCC family protein [Roseibium sp.]|uniref:SRPBCC family protein n=1 Tax=Roseibium sp. TaxID=1936156 RepID=UPI003BAEC583
MGELVIELEQACRSPVDGLWATLLTPSLWWGEGVLLEPHSGGAFHEPWRDAEGEHHTRGQVLAIEAPSRLRLSWRDDDWDFDTRVSFSLSGDATGSRIELRHEGWQHAAAERQVPLMHAHRGGWAMHLRNLVEHAEQTMGKGGGRR